MREIVLDKISFDVVDKRYYRVLPSKDFCPQVGARLQRVPFQLSTQKLNF